MSRRNIFEILSEKVSISSQINKIEGLLSDAYVGSNTLEDIVDMECMREWKARGRYTAISIRTEPGSTRDLCLIFWERQAWRRRCRGQRRRQTGIKVH